MVPYCGVKPYPAMNLIGLVFEVAFGAYIVSYVLELCILVCILYILVRILFIYGS